MNTINIKELSAFTDLSEELCLSILEIVESEFGEIGSFLIEDDCASFRVYRGYYEDASRIIDNGSIILKLIDKFERDFTLAYQIEINKDN